MNELNMLAMRVFGKRLKGKQFESMQRTLTQARSPIPAPVYMATAMLSAVFAAVAGLVVGIVFFGVLLGMSLGFTFALTLFSALILAVATYGTMTVYPSMTVSTLRSRIDPMLPHASAYMYALTSGGVSLVSSFKALSKQEEFGEVTKEASRLVREVEYFGHDIPTAISNAAHMSPSERFRNLLETLLSVVQTGGSVQHYFATKTKEFRADVVQEQKNFLETLSLMAEAYVIALGLVPILVITMVIVMGTMGMFYPAVVFIMSYIFIPFGTIGFMFIINLFTKGGESVKKAAIVGAAGKPTARGKVKKLKIDIRRPFRQMVENPLFVFSISVPIGVVFLVISALASSFTVGSLVAAIIIILAPFVFLYEYDVRRTEKMEERTPDFLRGLSSAVRSGLPLPRAVQTLSTLRLGHLTPEVRKMQREMKWGMPTLEAFDRFSISTKSVTISRVTALVKGVTEAGGNIGDVTELAAEEVITQQGLKRERRGAMMSYMIIVYMSFMVFVFVAIAMNSFLSGIMPQQGAAAPAQGTIGATQGIGLFAQTGFSADFVKQVFYHTTLIQAICSGAMAGMMSTGRVLSGLKHAIIMLIIGYFVFAVIIP